MSTATRYTLCRTSTWVKSVLERHRHPVIVKVMLTVQMGILALNSISAKEATEGNRVPQHITCDMDAKTYPRALHARSARELALKEDNAPSDRRGGGGIKGSAVPHPSNRAWFIPCHASNIAEPDSDAVSNHGETQTGRVCLTIDAQLSGMGHGCG